MSDSDGATAPHSEPNDGDELFADLFDDTFQAPPPALVGAAPPAAEQPTETVPLPRPAPGDLSGLGPAQLASNGQWAALAALAHHETANGCDLQASDQLVRHAHDPVAFTWMWALHTDASTRAEVDLRHLPRPLRIPADRVEAVAARVAAPVIAATPDAQAAMHLLRSLDPDDAGSIRVAWAVLDRQSVSYDEQADEAIRILGASRDPATRTRVLACARAAAKATPPQTRRRAQLVAALSLPLLGPEEQRATQDAADALTASQPWRPSWAQEYEPWAWPLLKTLVARLPAGHLAQLLNQPWVTDDGDNTVATEVFTTAFPTETLEGLLDQAMQLTPRVRAALVQSLAGVQDPQGQRLIKRAHRTVPLAQLAPLHQVLVRQVEETQHLPPPRRTQALVRLQLAALAVPRAQPADMGEVDWHATRHGAALQADAGLLAWTSVLRGGEVSQVALHGLTDDQLRHLGAAAGLLLRQARLSATEDDLAIALAEGDVIQLLGDTDDARCAVLLEGVTAVASGLLPDRLITEALQAGPASTAVVAASDPAPTTAVYRQLVASHRAGGGPVATQATDEADAQWVQWRSERALDLLESVPPDATSITSVTELVAALPWKDLADLDLLARASTALAARPTLFATQLSAAVSGLGDPSLASGCAARLPVLIDQVLATPGLANQLASGAGLDIAALIREVLDTGDEDLERAGQRWLTAAAPTPEVVQLAVESDQASALAPSPFAAARQAHARSLCQRSLDRAQLVPVRMQALHLAAHADAQQAHRTAATLLAWHLDRTAALPTTRRREVAEVFATTPAAPDDAGLGERLLGVEQDAAVRASLQRALRRMRSDTLEDVLAGLLACVGLSGEVGPLDPAICAALPQWSDRLRPHVDELLQVTSVHAPPRSVVHQMSVLGDLLSEHAVASVWEDTGTDKNVAKAAKLRDNAADKDDIGHLATTQVLQEKLKWLGSQSTLHEMRNGHAAPRGSTRPREITDRDALIATGLLGYVVTGWAQQLYDAAGQTLPDGAS